jgi:tetratricopeptide (TPR) repeat protein
MQSKGLTLRSNKDGNPHQLRGAIFASQGEPKKAIDEMTQALALNPQLEGARFQLGLLHFTSGNIFEAQSVWQAFHDFDERHPLRLFKTDMLHLAKDEFEDCVALLERGISLCNVKSINKDIRRVIDKVRAVVPAKPPAPAPAPAATQPLTQNNPQHVMLARYGQTRDDKSKA